MDNVTIPIVIVSSAAPSCMGYGVAFGKLVKICSLYLCLTKKIYESLFNIIIILPSLVKKLHIFEKTYPISLMVNAAPC